MIANGIPEESEENELTMDRQERHPMGPAISKRKAAVTSGSPRQSALLRVLDSVLAIRLENRGAKGIDHAPHCLVARAAGGQEDEAVLSPAQKVGLPFGGP